VSCVIDRTGVAIAGCQARGEPESSGTIPALPPLGLIRFRLIRGVGAWAWANKGNSKRAMRNFIRGFEYRDSRCWDRC
jgi:hypothetical protein